MYLAQQFIPCEYSRATSMLKPAMIHDRTAVESSFKERDESQFVAAVDLQPSFSCSSCCSRADIRDCLNMTECDTI